MKSKFQIVPLGNYVRQISQRNKGVDEVEVYSVTNSEGFTRSADYFSKEVFSKDVSNYKVVCRGQFAYNPSRVNVGSIDYLKTVDQALVSPLYIVFETDSGLYSDYLLRYLKSTWGNAQIRSNTEGAVRDSLKYKGLENIKIPLPPLEDQKRITYLLGKVEGAIAQRKQHLQQLDALRKSVFLEMFGDPIRNEKGWELDDFEGIMASARNGLSPSKSGKIKGLVYSLSAITGDSFKEIFKDDTFTQIKDVYFPSDNDFLVCRGNGNINLVGRGYFYPGNRSDIMFPDTMIGVTIEPNSINKIFLEQLWKTHFIRNQIEKGARTANGTYKINQKTLSSIKIIIPPEPIQKQFSIVAEKIESIKSSYQQSLTDLENLYGVLSQKAFKGELDLSRVSLTSDSTEETDAENYETNEPQHTTDTFGLPAPSDLATLNSTEGRNTLLDQWLTRWLEHLNGKPFSTQSFIDAAQQRLWELTEEDALEWELGVANYDQIKAWASKSLDQGRLAQIYDNINNRVQLKAVSKR